MVHILGPFQDVDTPGLLVTQKEVMAQPPRISQLIAIKKGFWWRFSWRFKGCISSSSGSHCCASKHRGFSWAHSTNRNLGFEDHSWAEAIFVCNLEAEASATADFECSLISRKYLPAASNAPELTSEPTPATCHASDASTTPTNEPIPAPVRTTAESAGCAADAAANPITQPIPVPSSTAVRTACPTS